MNETLLKDVITVLTLFDTASKHHSTDKECSLHMASATKYQITKHFQVLATNSNIIKEFKTYLKNVEELFSNKEMNRVATLLDQKFKRIVTKVMTEEEINETLKNLDSMIDDLPLIRPDFLNSNQNIPLEPPQKKRKIHKDFSGFIRN